MAYFTDKSYLMAGAKTAEQRIFIENLFSVIEQMIDEKMTQYFLEHKEILEISIKTLLNGIIVDMPAVREELINQILKQLSN